MSGTKGIGSGDFGGGGGAGGFDGVPAGNAQGGGNPNRPAPQTGGPGRSEFAPGPNKSRGGGGQGNGGPNATQTPGGDRLSNRGPSEATVTPRLVDNSLAQQIRHRLTSTQLPDPAPQRAAQATQTTPTNSPRDFSPARNDQSFDTRPRANDSPQQVNLRSQTGGDDRNVFDRRDGNQPTNLVRDARDAARTLLDPPGRGRDNSFNPNQANGRDRNGPPDWSRGSGRDNFSPSFEARAGSLGRGAGDLLGAASNYLRGASDGSNLAPETRALLRAVANELGPDFVNNLDNRSADKVFRVVERALEHYARAAERGEQSARVPQGVAHGLERHHDTELRHGLERHHGPDLRHGVEVPRGFDAPGRVAREVLTDVLGAAQLDRYLRQLEKTGGHVVLQAAAAVARALYGEAGGDRTPFVNHPLPTPYGGAEQRPHPQELLRDLRAGGFVPAHEQFNAFPLTGRARVVSEMMELMRTLDAIQSAVSRATAHATAAQRATAEASFVAWLKGVMSAGGRELDSLLSALLPATLPGRAARNEIPRLVAALGGMLTDADGRALLARDGTPLKLDRLVWLSTAGGLVDGSLLGSAFKGESFPARLSPLLLYGFDAVYSVLGFDGRTLATPHFVAVQAAANDAEREWVFGQQPFSLGWAREAIERLKDSALVEHNLLGETLEEALADGRFHVALVGVAVEEGRAAEDSAAVKQLLPGAAGDLAFA